MDRTDTTKLLTEVLIKDKLSDRKYYATEVTLDYGTNHSKRIDVMQFSPKGVLYTSDIEKGSFTCYEVKSCRADVYSGSGLNFYGEKNYIVITAETYRKLKSEIEIGYLRRYLSENYPESSKYYGIMVAVPLQISSEKEFEKEIEEPTAFEGAASNWKLWTAIPCRPGPRTRSTVELLFCMLRSKHQE